MMPLTLDPVDVNPCTHRPAGISFRRIIRPLYFARRRPPGPSVGARQRRSRSSIASIAASPGSVTIQCHQVHRGPLSSVHRCPSPSPSPSPFCPHALHVSPRSSCLASRRFLVSENSRSASVFVFLVSFLCLFCLSCPSCLSFMSAFSVFRFRFPFFDCHPLPLAGVAC